MKKQILKNLFSNYVGNFLSMALGFLIIPFLIKKLGKEAYGISVMTESVILLFQIVAFSLRIALSRHSTIALSQGKHHEFLEYLSSGKYILNFAAFLFFIPGSIFSFYFPQIFNVPLELHLQSRVLAFLIVLSFTVSIPNMIYWSVLYANHRFDLINYSNFGGMILRAIFIFIIFNFLPPEMANLITYGFIYLAMTVSQNYMVYLWHKSIMPGLRIMSKEKHLGKIKELLSFGGYATITGVASVIYESVMNVVINILMGSVFNAIYSISSKIPSLLNRLFLTPTMSLAPSFAHLVATNDRRRLKLLFLFYSKVINFIVLPIGLILIVFSKEIIVNWVGSDFKTAGEVMPIFLMASIFSIPAGICHCINTAFGKIKIPSFVNLCSSLVNVLIGIYLAFKMGLGLKGIALSVLFMNIFVFSIFMPVYACKIGDISIKDYWVEVWLKPMVWIFFTFGLFIISLLICNSLRNIFYIFIAGIILVPVYAIGVYKFLVSRDEKCILKDLLIPLLVKLGFKSESIKLEI